MDRRTMLRRLAANGAVAWVAPEILATKRASAMALSGCYIDYNFDDGTLQGWTENGTGPARWQPSSLHTFSGSHSAWFGRTGTTDSLHPVAGQPSYNHPNRRGRATMTSPPTTASATDVVCFQVRLAIENSAQYDRFRFYIVQGATRVQLWDKHQPGFTVIDHPQNPGSQWDLYTTNGAWVEIDVTIGTPPGINLANPVQFEFDFQTVDRQYNRTEGIYLDNIMLPCGVAAPPATTASRRESGSGSGLSLNSPASSGFQPGYRPPPKVPAPDVAREAPT
jgi:hypothetical protein